MSHHNNVNDIVFSKNTNDNYNVNVKDNKFDESKKVEGIAMQLVDKLRSPDSYEFYCKIAYKLPEHKIWSNYEQAIKGRNPGGLFNWLCRRDMTRE